MGCGGVGGGNKRRWEKVDERGGGGGERGRKEEGEEMSQSERERERVGIKMIPPLHSLRMLPSAAVAIVLC